MNRCKLVFISAFLLSCSCLFGSTWIESGSAGRLPATAQSPLGIGPLDGIIGSLDVLTEVDMYRIRITNPLQFSAFTIGAIGLVPDPQLFLFDNIGRGVYANDEAFGSQPELPVGHPLGPALPGIYFLAIGRFDNEPLGAGGFLFTQNQGTAVNGPDLTAGGAGPVLAWSDNVSGRIDFDSLYGIALTGADFASVPEPGTFLLTAAGLTLAGFIIHRRTR